MITIAPSLNATVLDALKGRALNSASLLRDGSPQEWVCHTGKLMIIVRWQQGLLGMGVGETEHEAYGGIRIVGIDNKRMQEDTQINFNEIIDFMNWTIDDDDWFE